MHDIHAKCEIELDDRIDMWIRDEKLHWQKFEPTSGFNALRFGPAHVVWEDENWDCIDFCIKECEDDRFCAWPEFAVRLVQYSLIDLKALGIENIEVCPEDYDGWNPANFPPPDGVEMVKK